MPGRAVVSCRQLCCALAGRRRAPRGCLPKGLFHCCGEFAVQRIGQAFHAATFGDEAALAVLGDNVELL
eukprot:10362994-Alexandrium_andersonii.AAC.1